MEPSEIVRPFRKKEISVFQEKRYLTNEKEIKGYGQEKGIGVNRVTKSYGGDREGGGGRKRLDLF